ncbi:hypothetical protein HK098_000892 [Nowakowskiella sp. JEL0407]|nr:hypothetical protein HK098_000892 [Nowakowskiella sp. JEL0407]
MNIYQSTTNTRKSQYLLPLVERPKMDSTRKVFRDNKKPNLFLPSMLPNQFSLQAAYRHPAHCLKEQRWLKDNVKSSSETDISRERHLLVQNPEKGEKFEIDAKVSIKPPKENNKIYDPILEALKDPSVDLHQLFRKLLLVREALQNGNTYFITVSSYETRAIPKDYDIPLEFLTQSEVLVHVAESCGPFIEGVNGKIKLECKDLLPIITYLGFSWWKHIFRPNTPLTHNLDDLFASKINFDSVFEAINLSSYLELPGLTGICTKLAANNLRSIKSFEDMQTDDIVKILRSARIVDLYLCEERVDLDYWVTASVWKSNYLQILQSRNLKQHTNLELNVSDDPYSYKKKCVTFFLQEYLNHILINRDRKFSNEDILKICEIEKENIADFHLTVFIPKPKNTENFFNALNFWRIVLRTLDKIQQLSLTVTTENEVSLDQNELARIAEFLLEIKENVRGSVNIILLAKIEKLGGGEPEITQLEETTKKFNKFQSQEPAKVNTSFPSAHFETAKSYQSAAKLNASFGTKSIIFLEFSEKGLPLDIWNFLLHRLLDAGHQVSQLDFNRIVMSPESSKIISTTLFSKLNCSPIQNISNLSFSYCKIGGTATTNLCANILKASIILKSLNLAGNVSNYDPKAFIAGRAIAELCSSQLNITEINLSDNNFTIGGLGAIFQSLAQNRHLKKILVDNTNIGPCFHDFSRILISQDCKIMDISLARNGLLPRTLDTFFKDLKIAKKSVNVRKTAISVNLNENLFSRHFVQSFKTFVNVFQLREIYLRCSATFLAGSNSSNIEESFHEYEKNQDISAILSGCSSTKPNSVTQLSEDSLVEIFAMICNSCNSDTLTTLDVSYHRMGDKVAGSIPNLLKSCNQLRQLVLSGNTISDEGLQRLIEDMENCNGMHQNRMIEIDLRESVFISDDVKKMVAKWNFESLSGVLIRFD